MEKAPLFKYFDKKEYADAMSARGLIRVGTLSGYRGLELLDQARNDAEDGVLHTTLRINENCLMEDLPVWKQMALRQMGHHVDNCPGGIFEDERHIYADCYVYCLATELSDSIGKEFDAKACVRINAPLAFGQAVTDKLYELGLITSERSKNLVGLITYYDQPYDFEKLGVRPIQFLKPSKFKDQKEVRFCWEPTEVSGRRPNQLEAMLLEIPEIAKLCEQVELIDDSIRSGKWLDNQS